MKNVFGASIGDGHNAADVHACRCLLVFSTFICALCFFLAGCVRDNVNDLWYRLSNAGISWFPFDHWKHQTVHQQRNFGVAEHLFPDIIFRRLYV